MWWLPPVLGAAAGALPGLLDQDGDVAVVGAFAGAGVGFLVDSMVSDIEHASARQCVEVNDRLWWMDRQFQSLYRSGDNRRAQGLSDSFSTVRLQAAAIAKDFPEARKEATELAEEAKRLERTYKKADHFAAKKMTKRMGEHVHHSTWEMYAYWQHIKDRLEISCGAPGPEIPRPQLLGFEPIPEAIKKDVQVFVKKRAEGEQKRAAPKVGPKRWWKRDARAPKAVQSSAGGTR